MRAWLIVIVLAAAAVARADPATDEFERAKASYSSSDYVTASAAFQRAFELDGRAEYLFGWAQAERKRGNCPLALELYLKLTAMPLEADQREATRLAMAQRCDLPAKPPVVEKLKPRAVVVERPIVVERDRWYRDWGGHAFSATGVALLGVGSALIVTSVSTEREARGAFTIGEREQLADRAQTFRISGIATVVAGAVAGAYAAYRYVKRTRSKPRRVQSVSR